MVDACNVLKTFINQRGVIGKHISIVLNFNITKDQTNDSWAPVAIVFTAFHHIQESGSKYKRSMSVNRLCPKYATVRLAVIFQTTHIGNCCHSQHFIKIWCQKRLFFSSSSCYWKPECYLSNGTIEHRHNGNYVRN